MGALLRPPRRPGPRPPTVDAAYPDRRRGRRPGAPRAALHGVGPGRFAAQADRIELWRVLATITARKARQAMRDERREKRGGGLVVSEATLDAASDESAGGLARFAAPDMPPDLTVEMADECRRLLEMLGDEELRTIAVWKMEGLTSEEIAGRLGKALSTVERRLRLIRDTWDEDLSDPP
ncbi:MAG: ECF-type sigma factor [Gemmataceae bacterium]